MQANSGKTITAISEWAFCCDLNPVKVEMSDHQTACCGRLATNPSFARRAFLPLHLPQEELGLGRVSALKGPKLGIMHFILLTRSGKTEPSKLDQVRCIRAGHSRAGDNKPQFCYEHHDASGTLDWNKSLSSWLG